MMDLIEIEQKLQPWHDGPAQVWDYMVSLATLRVRLMSPGHDPSTGRDNSVILCFGDCHDVRFVPWWSASHITVEDRGAGLDPRYLVEDGGNLRVECNVLWVTKEYERYEHIPPIHKVYS